MIRIGFGLVLALLILPLPALSADATKAGQFYENGLARFERKDDAGAIVQLKNALQQDPSYLSAHLLLGRTYLRLGDARSAEMAFTTAERMGVDRSEIALPLAQAYMRQGKFQELLERVRADGLSPAAALDLWLVRAYAHMELGDFVGAESALRAATTLDAKSGQVSAAQGMYHLQRGDRATARRFADEAISRSPGEAKAWNLKASIAHASGESEAALDGYGRAIALVADYVDARVARAALLMDLNRIEDAFQDLSWLKEKHPEEARASYLRSIYYSRKGNDKAAKAELLEAAKAVSAIPANLINRRPQLLMLGGLAYFGLNAPEKAKGYLETYSRLLPGDPGVRKLLGAIYLNEKQADAAVSQLELAYQANPRDPQIVTLLAAAYLGKKQSQKAAALLEKSGQAVQANPKMGATLGISLIGAGQEDLGLKHLTRAFQQDASQTKTGLALVLLLIGKGQTAEAVQMAEAMVRATPKNAVAQNILGLARVNAGDHKAARVAYEKALSLDARLDAARLNLARLEVLDQRFDAARQHLNVLLKTKPDHGQALFELARTEESAGRYAQAVQGYQRLIAREPNHMDAHLRLAEVQLRQGQLEAALETAKQASGFAPDDTRVLAVLGRIHAALGQTNLAKTAYARMSRVAGFDVAKLTEAAAYQIAAKDLAGAGLSLDKALNANPGSAQAQALMIQLELARGQPAQAEQRAKALVTSKPGLAVGYRLLGDVASLQGRHNDAVHAYRDALAKENAEEDVVRLYQALSRSGDAVQGLVVLEGWLKKYPDHPAASFALAEGYLRLGNLNKARLAYEAILKKQGDNAGALNNLAEILHRQGDAKALGYAERAYQLMPADAGINDTLGWILAGQGQIERALRHLREARQRTPGNPDIRYHLASALARGGRPDEARQELDFALRSPRFESRDEALALLKSLPKR